MAVIPLHSHRYRFGTDASADAVWRTLTDVSESARYLHGLVLVSDWTPGSIVDARLTRDDGPRLSGIVLVADPPRLLTFTLDHGVGGTATYITWKVHAEGVGSVVELLVDEIDGLTDDEADAAWLPVLARVQAHVSTAA